MDYIVKGIVWFIGSLLIGIGFISTVNNEFFIAFVYALIITYLKLMREE